MIDGTTILIFLVLFATAFLLERRSPRPDA